MSRVYCLATSPRIFSELKSGGGGNSYAVPHGEKWGDASPRPTPIDARGACVRACINVNI